jgi:hypothetical protein
MIVTRQTEAPKGRKTKAEQMRIVAEVERRLSVVEELESVVSATCNGKIVCGNPSLKKHSQASDDFRNLYSAILN